MPRASITHDFIDFDADDSGAVPHEVVPPTDEEIEAEIDAFFASFTVPTRTREQRS